MNERFLQIANEANKDIGYTFKMEEAKQLHELMEKFAELIVRECISIIDVEIQQQEQVALSNNRDSIWVNGKIEHFIKIKMKTKEHFGVDCYTQEELDAAQVRGARLAQGLKVE